MFVKVKRWHDRNGKAFYYPQLQDGRQSSCGVSTKKKVVLFVGLHDSGKTRVLNKLYERAKDVWSCQMKIGKIVEQRFIFISCKDSIAHWRIFNNVKEKSIAGNEELVNISKNAIVFVDDIDSLSSVKLQLLKRILSDAFRIVSTAKDETHINPSIRNIILRKDVQIHRLKTEVSFDSTGMFMWFLTALFGIAGQYEIMTLLVGLKLLGSRRK